MAPEALTKQRQWRVLQPEHGGYDVTPSIRSSHDEELWFIKGTGLGWRRDDYVGNYGVKSLKSNSYFLSAKGIDEISWEQREVNSWKNHKQLSVLVATRTCLARLTSILCP